MSDERLERFFCDVFQKMHSEQNGARLTDRLPAEAATLIFVLCSSIKGQLTRMSDLLRTVGGGGKEDKKDKD